MEWINGRKITFDTTHEKSTTLVGILASFDLCLFYDSLFLRE